MMRYAPWLIGLLCLGVLAYGLMMQWRHPPRITGTGSLVTTNPKTGVQLKLLTRTVEVGGISKIEVQLPNGTWTDCVGGNCADTVRREYFELFETLRERGN